MENTTPRVLANFFIERKQYQDEFTQFLANESETKIRNIHTLGDGGIGKTRLILKMLESCESNGKVGLYSPLIDFYHANIQSKTGLIKQLIKNLNINEKFSNSLKVLNEISANPKLLSENISQKLENAFLNEYGNICTEYLALNKFVVLFFDTYEVIQYIDIDNKPQTSYFSNWLETIFFKKLLEYPNTRIVIAGRYTINTLSFDKNIVKSIYLEPFNQDDSRKFLSHFLNPLSIFLTETQEQFVFELTERRPILLALFVDRLIQEKNINSFEIFIRNNEQDEKKKEKFEPYLIELIINGNTEEANFIRTIAFAYLKMTPEMYAYVWEEPIHEVTYLGDTTSKIHNIFNQLGVLAFVKTKNDSPNYETIVLLHDEVRFLIQKYYWEVHDANQEERKSIATVLVEYYDEILNPQNNQTELSQNDQEEIEYQAELSPIEKTALLSEKLYYLMFSEPEGGINLFTKEFDKRIKGEYELEVCDFLLKKVEEFKKSLSESIKAVIFWKRLDLYNQQYMSSRVIELLGKYTVVINDMFKKLSSEEKTLFEMRFKFQKAIAHHWKYQFKEAIKLFVEVERFFRKINHNEIFNDELLIAMKWLGYSNYAAGNYSRSEKVFKLAIGEFKQKTTINASLIIEIANIYSNMNVLLRAMGKFRIATMYAEMAISIAREQDNKRELLRFLNAYAETCHSANRIYEAERAYQECEVLLENVPDPLLSSRVLLGKTLLSYKHYDLVSILLNYGNYTFSKDIAKKLSDEGQLPTEENLNKLKEAISQKTDDQYWLATNYFYLGEVYNLLSDWNNALNAFEQSIQHAKDFNHRYREVAALIGELFTYCYNQLTIDDLKTISGRERIKEIIENQKYTTDITNIDIVSLLLENNKTRINELFKEELYPYLKGKLNIVEADLYITKYQQTNDFEYVNKATRCLVIACDAMYQFDQYAHYFNVLRGMQKRLTWMLETKENSYSDRQIKDLNSIWRYDDESELTICKEYGNKFDEIIEHILVLRQNNSTLLDEKVLEYTKKIEDSIEYGQIGVRFAPFYGEMLIDIQKKKQDITEFAAAWKMLGRAYRYNDRTIRSQQSYKNALKDAEQLGNKLLQADICIELGASLYRHGEYEKIIEFYRREEINQNRQAFLEKYKIVLEEAKHDYFDKATALLKEIPRSIERYKVAASLDFRLGEYLVITQPLEENSKITRNIARYFRLSIKRAVHSGRIRLAIDALQSLIAYYYFAGFRNKADIPQNIQDDIAIYSHQINELYAKKSNSQILIGKYWVIEGNVIYDQLFEEPNNLSKEEIREKLKQSFEYYIRASDYKLRYSEKFFYEAMQIIFRRISSLPLNYIPFLQEIYKDYLFHKKPTGLVARNAYQLVEDFLSIRQAYYNEKQKNPSF